MSGKQLGVCVIGTGRAGMIHGRNYASGIPGASLVALSDPYEPALKAARDELGTEACYPTLTDALDDPRVDAVVVVTPTDLHRDVVMAAANAGKHVFCEKPMAMDARECEEMIAGCDDAGVKLQLGFMRRFDYSYRAAHDRVTDGEIGELNQVKSLTRGPSVPQPWMLDVAKSNGPLAEVSSHDIDTLRWFVGSEITQVNATAGNYRCRDQADVYPDFYDTFLVTCRFADGTQGLIEGAVSVGYGYDARTELLGSDGVMFVGDLRGDRVAVHRRGGQMQANTVASWRNLFTDAYRAEAASFVQAVLNDTTPEVTGDDGLQAVRVVNAGNESIRTGRPVELMEATS